jgi:hypothetical protein
VISVLEIVLRTIPNILPDNTSPDPFFIIECFVIGWFTLEFTIRFLVYPNKLQFLISPFNICEFISIFPFYIFLAVPGINAIETFKDISRMFRVIGLLQIFQKSDDLGFVYYETQIFKLKMHNPVDIFVIKRTILLTLKNSVKEILVFVCYLTVAMLIFSVLLFEIEINADPNSLFSSIPAASWWCVQTFTTLGYGDISELIKQKKMFF